MFGSFVMSILFNKLLNMKMSLNLPNSLRLQTIIFDSLRKKEKYAIVQTNQLKKKNKKSKPFEEKKQNESC